MNTSNLVSGLAAHIDSVGSAITSVSNLTAVTSDILMRPGPPSRVICAGLKTLSDQVNKRQGDVSPRTCRSSCRRWVVRPRSGSWFQFYLCGIDVVAGNGKSTLLTKPLVSLPDINHVLYTSAATRCWRDNQRPGVTKLTDQTTPAPAQPKKSRRFAGKRTPVSIGGIGILVVLMVAVSAFFLNELPLVGAGARYSAEFTEAAGLRRATGPRCRYQVGEVDDVALDGERVR